MGYGNEQRHRFQCHECNEPISFDLSAEGADITGAEFTDEETGANGKTSYQYLSPDFVANAEDARDPTYFGSMELMDRILKTPHAREALAKLPKGEMVKPDWFALANALPDWEKLFVCWRLERSGKYFLSCQNLGNFDKDAGTSSWLAAVRLGFKLFGPNERLLGESRRILKSNPVEAARLVIEHGSRWAPDFKEAQFRIFADFFKRWDAFSQVYLYVQNGIEMPGDPAATSVDFEHVRGFYSSAQEFFSKQIGLIVAINNIGSGRKFDALNSISLTKYFTTDNAKRCDSFKSNTEFASAVPEYDSGLRNAEAHGWLNVTPENQTLFYLQGGNGARIELRYVDYLRKSVLMFKQICQLMQLENILRMMALRDAYRLISFSADD